MSMIGFPLLLIPFAIYNIFVFLMPGVAFTSPIATVTLLSGATWTATFGDALLVLGIFLLLFEVIKAARPGARYLTDHLLSLIASGAAVAEFLLLAPFGTSAFFLLTVLMIVEFLAGVSIGFRNRHRRVPAAVRAGIEREPASVPANPAPANPAPVSHAPVSHAPTEPSFDRTHQNVTPAEPVFPSPQPAPEPEVVPKPVPTLAVIRNSEGAVPAPERKISDWNVSDLVIDSASDGADKTPPRP